MGSTRADEEPAGSGIVLPPGVSRTRWWTWFRANRGRHRAFRVGVFVVGLVLTLGGAAMWLVSSLLAALPVLLGLWVWSREFHWGHRLYGASLRQGRAMWSRVRLRPVRWALITVAGFGAAWAGYWAWGQYGLPGVT